MRTADDKHPMLSDIQREIGLTKTRAMLVLALSAITKCLNVSRNMTDQQVAVAADLIIKEYWYYTIPEVKDCLQQALVNEKLYERLDVNVVMQWFRDYDIRRDEKIIEFQSQEKKRHENEIKEPMKVGSSFDEYRQRVAAKAAQGDKQAIEDLKNIESVMASSPLSIEAQRQKEIQFKLFKAQYDKRKTTNSQ
jgi:hypothetical protein